VGWAAIGIHLIHPFPSLPGDVAACWKEIDLPIVPQQDIDPNQEKPTICTPARKLSTVTVPRA
jgi:hypothetical protein